MSHPLESLLDRFESFPAGQEMAAFVERAYPICRSITGEGVRQTLDLLRETIPLEVREVPTGTPILDWTVPKEWNAREAWIKDPEGRTVVSFADHNLHLLGYSVPVHQRLPLAELQEHLFSLPDQPDLIPYRTSYYRETWGFCLPHRVRQGLPEGEYEVFVDSSLEDGSLTYGEFFLPGETDEEILISTHICHPSLANDNLSGLAVVSRLAALLAKASDSQNLRYTYRFVFVPGTVGSITWLARNEERAAQISHGLVAANLGDPGGFHYKRSRRGSAEIDRAVLQVLEERGEDFGAEDFIPFGYDERQYCSPGFNLPVGSLTRTPYGRYPEYHTSADNPSFVRPESLAGSLETYARVLALLEGNGRYQNLKPKGEPQLGRRGLYRSLGGEGSRDKELALLWVLNLSDGDHDLLAIAERSKLPFRAVRAAADALLKADLLKADPLA